MRLGGTKTIKVDVRIIAATNVDLEDMIRRKAFRDDLFYRLNVIKIELPPLRHRKEDIPLLVKHFLEHYSRENNKVIEGLADDVWETLENYHWPGNIRELENLVERAVVFTKTRIIDRSSLPPFHLADRSHPALAASAGAASMNFKEQLQAFQRQVIAEALRRSRGVQKQAAKMLGLKPTTLNEMIKRLGLDMENLS